jgi:cell wall-associated NlpC family hydrolase
MKRNLLGVIFVGLAAVGILTIVKAQNNIDNASAAETVDFDSIIVQSDTNEYNTDIDTQELGLLGADVLGLDEIEIPAEASVEEAVETYAENDDENDDENEYADLAIANVTNYVNVRSNPDTDSEIVGKIYNGAVAQVLSTAGDNNDWFQIVSGNVEGYIKAEFFIYGEDAADVIDNYVTRYAVVIADRLNVREEPSTDAKRIGYIDNGEKVKIVENQGEWLKVEYTTDKIGYVATEYVNITEEFVYAKTIAEEQAEIAASKVFEERENVSEETASENVTITVTPPSANYSSSSELRNSIVEYSMQFLGNKYVHGGQSLVTGTDCSGFTSLIYKEFGYSVSRTPEGQLSSSGRSISYSEIQPGDIICYGSSGKCTHVALYIGNGQIIHSANSRKGVVIYNADYDTILGVKNIID